MVASVEIGLTDDEYQSLAPSLIDDVEEGSVFFEQNAKVKAPLLDWPDIEIGNVLGEGGFCTVQELLVINSVAQEKAHMNIKKSSIGSGDETLAETCDSANSHILSQIELMASQCQESTISPFVVKRIKDSFKGKMHTRAFIDLSCEVKFLSSLSHRNIIKLRGVSSMYDDPNCSDQNNRLFILLDRIYITLNDQFQFWKKRMKKLRFHSANSIENCKLKIERVEAATDLSSALKYLHRHKIMYRDLKPENIGFDANGVLKLFDFGLCRELRKKDLDSSGEKLYKLTPFVGSIPYMAPEVYFGKPYNLNADVYSFGLLLYEMACLKPLFQKKLFCGSKQDFYDGMRPEFPLKDSVSITLANLIAKCWSETHNKRPHMNYVHATLKIELEQLTNEAL